MPPVKQPPAEPEPAAERMARWARGERSEKAPDLDLGVGPEAHRMALALFQREVLRRVLGYGHAASWATSAESIRDVSDVSYFAAGPWGEEALIEDDDVAARVTLMDGQVFAHVAGQTSEPVEARLSRLVEELPRAVPGDEQRVPVTFWSLGTHGPVARSRQIEVPTWAEIGENYAPMATADLAPLMGEDFQPGTGGQLVLWHGPPGTGKTYALRALAWQWRKWCDLHYVTDPEAFFGEKAAYMLDVLLAEDDFSPAIATPDGRATTKPKDTDPRAAGGRWRLLVLEDASELMSADARERSGQGLSRLLNVVDGLIGQGLRILVLMTTNEKVQRLHPAISRAGRCAARVEFPALPRAEAAAWLKEHRPEVADTADLAAHGTWTLADLYAIAEDRETSDDRQPEPAGFGG